MHGIILGMLHNLLGGPLGESEKGAWNRQTPADWIIWCNGVDMTTTHHTSTDNWDIHSRQIHILDISA